MKLRVLVVGLSCCFVLTACGEDKSATSTETAPAAKEEPAKMPAPVEEESSGVLEGLPMSEEEHGPQGEPFDAPPIPSQAGQ